MPVQKPQDWPGAFEACVNAGDVDSAIALYEPGCAFVAPDSGATIMGREGIRPALAEKFVCDAGAPAQLLPEGVSIVLSSRCGPGRAVRYVDGDNTTWSMEKPSSRV